MTVNSRKALIIGALIGLVVSSVVEGIRWLTGQRIIEDLLGTLVTIALFTLAGAILGLWLYQVRRRSAETDSSGTGSSSSSSSHRSQR